MKSKRLLLLLLMALIAPWAMNAQNSIPFNEGFESMTSVDDLTAAGWTLSTTESGTFLAIETGASNVYEGAKSLNLDAWDASSSSSVQYLGLPLVAGDLNTLQISFAYKVTSGTINVGYLTDATDFSTFTSLAQYSSSSSFTVVTTDLSEAPRDAARLVLKYTGWYRCYLDSFEVKAIPSCQAATSITASDITATSATIAWEGEGNTWNLKYNGIEVNGISAMSYNLTSLTDGTNYTVSVQNVCGDGTTTDWISTTFRTPELCPDGKICIGEGTTTSTYLPANNYYSYSLSQQIYTADEIGEAGAILSIDFFKAATTEMVKNLDIYMVSTTKDEFESTTDFIPVTSSDLVFSGTVTFADNAWTTIELDAPFIYDGTSNVAIMVDNNTGGYVSSTPFYVFSSDKNQALYAQNDYTNFDPFAPSFSSKTAQKNRIRLVVGEPPACPKPTGLAVDYQGGTEATISWTSDATAWNMRVNGTEINGTITNPYTLTGLELATTYEVEVQANCGDATSEWAGPVSFKTDNCMPEDQCALTFVVTDSYGDGWNGASIQIYDYTGEELGDLLATVTNENLDGLSGSTAQPDGETQTITLNFCNGQELAIVWVEGGYDDECSYTITDLNDDVVAQDDMELAIAYTINCTVTDCRTPSDFVASEIGNHSVKLSWTENGPATEWVIAYLSENDEEITEITVNTNPYILTGLTPETMYAAQVTPVCEVDKPSEIVYWTTDVACPKPTNLSVTAYPTSAEVTWNGIADAYDLEWALLPASESKDALWLQYDNGTYDGGIGNSTANTWTWGVMYPASMLDGNGLLSKVSIYENSTYNTADITINVYTGGDDAPGTLVYTETITPEAGDAFHEINLAEPVMIDPTQNLWITLTEYGTYVLSYCDNGDNANNDWVLNGGTWSHIGDLASSLAGDTWMIRGYVEPGFDPSTLEWNPVSGITSPHTLEGLQPETTYVVRVKAICGGEDGESEWTMTTFTTPSACDMPIDLAANDITYNSAKLSWTGYQESYNLRYRRTPYVATTYFSEDFDEGLPATWTTIDNDTTTVGNWIALSEINNVYTYYTSPLTGWAHSGDDAVASASFVNGVGAVATDNYLVTPQVTFNGKLRFYATSEYQDPDTYEVLLSTTGNSISDFNVTLQAMGPATYGAWDEVIIDLSDYAGQQGYIAIHHVATDKYWLVIDDFGMYDLVYEDWTNVTATENTYTATGLTPKAEYEWQVQGVNANCGELDWTEIQSFTTLEKTTETQTVQLINGTNWFSTYVEITLEDLQNALAAATPSKAITIKSQNANSIYAPRTHKWTTGSAFTWNVANMYQIIMAEACEITLEDMPIDPTAHSITIAGNGVTTWIGFPFSEAMTVTNAFAALPPTTGDNVKYQNSNAIFSRNKWSSGITNLEPGKGYQYISAPNSTNRTLVYPAPSKAKSIVKPMMPQDSNSLKSIEHKTFDLQIPQAPSKSAKETLIERFEKLNNK